MLYHGAAVRSKINLNIGRSDVGYVGKSIIINPRAPNGSQ